ncbi:MAG: ribosomal L7Ae/L30e/S12e/Gadd45 family protein [Firmicutes bacterium]|nr:ribosomal L7Ae/L30e/S12e/Gadd45 family protein [Bacillota bacterium]
MPLEQLEMLRAAKKRSVGINQTLKALGKGQVQMAFVARDAEEQVLRELRARCQEEQIEMVTVDSMLILGKACGIEVGAAAAAILRG